MSYFNYTSDEILPYMAGGTVDFSREFTPQLYPPFPSEAKPCAKLATFNLAVLLQDKAQQKHLFEVCKTKGFFYLDFAGSAIASLPADAERICAIAEDIFHLPQEEKERYAYGGPNNRSIFGYKRAGHTKTDAKGTPDTAEFFNISKDVILGTDNAVPHPLPSFLMSPPVRSVLAQYQRSCHFVGTQILAILADQLGLSPNALDDKHRLDKPSGDHIRMTRGPARRDPNASEIQTPGHTDFGEITILFNWLGGLQVWSEASRGNFHNGVDPESSKTTNRIVPAQWLYVPPKPGCAILNLGDAMVHYTGGILCSGRHRVIPAPGVQGRWPRYSIVYFVRPEDDTVLARMTGGMIPPYGVGEGEDAEEEVLTAKQWIMQQATKMAEGVNKVPDT